MVALKVLCCLDGFRFTFVSRFVLSLSAGTAGGQVELASWWLVVLGNTHSLKLKFENIFFQILERNEMLGVVVEEVLASVEVFAVEPWEECEVRETWGMGGVWNTGHTGKDREVWVKTAAKFQYLGPWGSASKSRRWGAWRCSWQTPQRKKKQIPNRGDTVTSRIPSLESRGS